MSKKSTKKAKIHPRNKHCGNYDFDALIKTLPELDVYVILNKYQNKSIDFFDQNAVKALNKALLKHYYNIDYWDIPQDYLCPPIPGRADYIHHVADLLAKNNNDIIPKGDKVKVLDIGTGANCIYPIIGNAEYAWRFVGSDMSKKSLESANKNIENNENLSKNVELRLQKNIKNIFKGIIKENECFNLTICNPPFHSSKAEATKGTLRKLNNLKKQNNSKLLLNFGGQNNELWCTGGEIQFIKTMIIESKSFANQVLWFTTLVSKEAHLQTIYQMLKKAKVAKMRTINMAQGNKQSRVVAWTFNKEIR
ncbi:MAG: 23S rRNA (adenine(1618)-N(6))-methyltransferase RlmF [Chitinophagales bacterium]